MALQRKERCIRLKQRNNRCVKFLKCDEHFKNGTVPSCRYEAKLKTKRNEQILVAARNALQLHCISPATLIWQAEEIKHKARLEINLSFHCPFLYAGVLFLIKKPLNLQGLFKVFRLLISHQRGLLCLKR